jgi:hypothetical protein
MKRITKTTPAARRMVGDDMTSCNECYQSDACVPEEIEDRGLEGRKGNKCLPAPRERAS